MLLLFVELSTSVVFKGVFILHESTLPMMKSRYVGEDDDVVKHYSQEDGVTELHFHFLFCERHSA